MKKIYWVFLGFLVASSVTQADIKSRIESEVVKPILDKKQAVGLVIGVLRGSTREIYGFGETTPGSKTAPDKNALFQIGSVSKTFTSLALAQTLKLDSKVTLSDRVTTYFPTLKLPKSFEKMTLQHLATHTSGLKGLPYFHIKDIRNPYAGITEADLLRDLDRSDFEHQPGEGHAYSNFGMGLLGFILEKHWKLSFDGMIAKLITGPLKMIDTAAVTFSADQKKRIVPNHDFDQKKTAHWDIPVLGGAGAMFSTGTDMMKYLEAQISPPKGTLGEAIAVAQKPLFEIKDAKGKATDFHQGLGWLVYKPKASMAPWIFHNGMTGGSTSIIGFIPGFSTGVFILSNQSPVYQPGGAQPTAEQMQVIDKAAIAICNILFDPKT